MQDFGVLVHSGIAPFTSVNHVNTYFTAATLWSKGRLPMIQLNNVSWWPGLTSVFLLMLNKLNPGEISWNVFGVTKESSRTLVPTAHASTRCVRKSRSSTLWTAWSEMFKHVFLTGPPGNTRRPVCPVLLKIKSLYLQTCQSAVLTQSVLSVTLTLALMKVSLF